MIIQPHIAGSVCVVKLLFDRYIDARKDIRYPGYVRLEDVRNGYVQRQQLTTCADAPYVILDWIRKRS